MPNLLNRYRNATLLVLVLGGQLFLLGYQVRNRTGLHGVRNWAVSGVLPLARAANSVRTGTVGAVNDYMQLSEVREQNRKLLEQLTALRLENQYLKAEIDTADRAQALAAFARRGPSKYVAARIIGTDQTGRKVVFVDRGTSAGVKAGMAVVTPYGIAGKVTAAYPSVSRVLLITDPSFAAGVVSAKGRYLGILKGQGHSLCAVDYIQNEETLEAGEWFYTSGDDRVFPKGLPVGQVKAVRPGKMLFKEVSLAPSGLGQGLEEVLIVLEGVHGEIPDDPQDYQPLELLTPPPATGEAATNRLFEGAAETDADKVVERYRNLRNAQGHRLGGGGVPNFGPALTERPEAARAETRNEPRPDAEAAKPAPRTAPPAAPPVAPPPAPASPEPQP